MAETDKNPTIELFTHSSIRIRCTEGVIYVDPFKIKEASSDADYVFITHDHYDHFSPEDIEKISNGTTVVVVPEKMEKKAEVLDAFVGRIEAVNVGERYTVGSLEFEVVPSYNILKPFHPKSAGWAGYIIKADEKRVYIAGDTDLTKEASAVKCDIALVPIGGTYTTDAKKAAELVNTIQPMLAIPTHYGSVAGKEKDAEVFKEHVKPPIKVDIIKQY